MSADTPIVDQPTSELPVVRPTHTWRVVADPKGDRKLLSVGTSVLEAIQSFARGVQDNQPIGIYLDDVPVAGVHIQANQPPLCLHILTDMSAADIDWHSGPTSVCTIDETTVIDLLKVACNGGRITSKLRLPLPVVSRTSDVSSLTLVKLLLSALSNETQPHVLTEQCQAIVVQVDKTSCKYLHVKRS